MESSLAGPQERCKICGKKIAEFCPKQGETWPSCIGSVCVDCWKPEMPVRRPLVQPA